MSEKMCQTCRKKYTRGIFDTLNPELCDSCSNLKVMTEHDDHIKQMAKDNPKKFNRLYGEESQ